MGFNCYGESCCTQRSFYTKEEKIEALKEYKDNLDKESKGITERIASLEKEE